MMVNQNLFFDGLELFQHDIINIDEYLPCYGEDSYQPINDPHNKIPAHTHQLINSSPDVLITHPTDDGYRVNELHTFLEEFESQMIHETIIQPTQNSSDVQSTQRSDNDSVKLEIDIRPTPTPSNLSMSEFLPIYDDLSNPTPHPTTMLSDNTHESEPVPTSPTRNNGKPNAYQLHNIIVEPENKQKFAATIDDENFEWVVSTHSCECVLISHSTFSSSVVAANFCLFSASTMMLCN